MIWHISSTNVMFQIQQMLSSMILVSILSISFFNLMVGRLSEWTEMPASIMDWAAYEDNPLLAAQLAYDIPSLQQFIANNLQTFNEEKKTAYNIVFDSAMNE